MTIKHLLEQQGYVITDPILDQSGIDTLLDHLKDLRPGEAVLEKSGSVYGVRDLLRQAPALAAFVETDTVRKLVATLLSPRGRMVRAIFFDKTPETNWKVVWHQDCTIAVKERVDVPGFDLWTVKAGIPHVRPPSEILERMITLRFHLDDCDESNGALKVIAGSHAHGRLSADSIADLAQQEEVLTCNVKAGGVLAMKPLVIHASSSGTKPVHRRVLHFEFSADNLPSGLEWYDAA